MISQDIYEHIPFKTFIGNQDIPLTLFRASAQDPNGFMWFGTTFDGGIARYDGYDWAFIYDDPNDEETISSNHIIDMKFSSTGILLASTWDGLNVIYPESMKVKTFRHDPNDVNTLPHKYAHAILESTKDLFWVGSPDGLALININSGYCERLKLTDNFVGTITGNYVDNIQRDRFDPNKIWVISDLGLFSLEEKERNVKFHPHPKEFNGRDDFMNWVDFIQDDQGVLWICRGWEQGGIYTYSPRDSRWQAYVYQGPVKLFDQRVGVGFYGIYPGFGDTLFFSSNVGNGFFEKNSGKYTLFPYEEGKSNGHSAGRTIHVVPDRHGRLWWAGNNGITRSSRQITPIAPIQKAPSVHITSLTVDSTDYLFPPFPDLDFGQSKNHFKAKFAIPNPEFPEQVIYSVMLKGREREWTTLKGINFVEYHNLPAGEYTLIIRGDEGNGWVKEAQLPVKVRIPIYQTKLFLISLLTGVFLMFGLGFVISNWFRKKREEKVRKMHKRQLDEMQMSSLRAQMNPHFLFNSLNSIKYYAITKDKDDTAAYLSKFAMLVRTILNNSKSDTISLKDEIEALRLYIEIEHLRLEGRFDYEIDVDESIEVEQAQIPPMILQPYVENAIWHGLMHKPDRGTLRIQIRDLGTKVQCIIDDDGVGRKKVQTIQKTQHAHKKSVGMKITRDRIALINSLYGIDTQVEVVDRVGQDQEVVGTRVIVIIPRILSP